eukprot:GHVH01017301.1.p1 GENE.GHVH01017301.1~~GHVH01017301.1.p1  ORF type:complete len:635 (+),score=70.36 GHVH01017301.1:1023-2927(+)
MNIVVARVLASICSSFYSCCRFSAIIGSFIDMIDHTVDGSLVSELESLITSIPFRIPEYQIEPVRWMPLPEKRIIITYKMALPEEKIMTGLQSDLHVDLGHLIRVKVKENITNHLRNRRRLFANNSIVEIYQDKLGMEVIECDEIRDCDELKLLYSREALVEGVYDDEIFVALDMVPSDLVQFRHGSDSIPNDTQISSQWYHLAPNGINTKEYWEMERADELGDSEQVVVAVIDSGVDFNHEDMVRRIWINPDEECGNGIDDDQNGYIDDCNGWNFIDNNNQPLDDNGHGTASATLIAGASNNENGIAGLCWNCKIMPLKALDNNLQGKLSKILLAINYALKKGAKISNHSYGASGDFPALRNAIERTNLLGMLVIASAGNFGNDSDHKPVYPASFLFPNVISVGATDKRGRNASFTNYGSLVDISAPGVDVLAGTIENGYHHFEGTSFAAPLVTGVLASVYSYLPYISMIELKELMISSASKGVYYGNANGAKLNYGRMMKNAVVHRDNMSTCARLGFDVTCGGDTKFDKYRFRCVDKGNSFSCDCRKGFSNSRDGTCQDINECDLDGQCPRHSRCINLPGTFECQCDRKKVWNVLMKQCDTRPDKMCDSGRRDCTTGLCNNGFDRSFSDQTK